MKIPSFLLTTLALGLLAVLAFGPQDSVGQTGDMDAQTAALLAELRVQQKQLAENQARIDEKMATVGEALRVARIFVSRGGAVR